MVDKKLETLAYRLKDMSSLRNLFSELNFDFADKPVNKDSWNEEQKRIAKETRIIARKNDYSIYYIQTDTDSLKEWKGIATKIIKDNHGLCMICSHNPRGFKWVFSGLSKEFSKSFSETRHVPIDIKPDTGVPKTFVEFLEKIRVGTDSTASSIISQVSDAFDSFAIQIHNELTVNVFEALKAITEGIILDKSNNLVSDEHALEEIREPTFILLYRIMFVLYAEDRSIFPDEEFYHDNFSLKWIKSEWILKQDHKVPKYAVQERLKKLFRLIEMGSEDLDYDPKKFFMRSYYGRLFDRKIHSKLNEWKIPNENLLVAIGLLTRTRDNQGNYFFLDYAALETRHLGAIYEHLLEYHLTIKDGKVADLPNSKERKSTGSYYTPKYIVDYIVENSVGPLIDDIKNNTSGSGEQIDKILALNILDPAMGSGHFLVGVTNYIAGRICEIEHGSDYSEQVFVECKRDVVRRCVYGVDKNPLAVDLASISLWLETLSSEKPLSFLSAHLKAGNSLIGSSINDILDKQTTLMESTNGRTRFKKTVRDFIMLEMLEDDTAEAVKTKTVKYSKMKSKGTVYYDLKFLLDAKLAKSFGVDVPPIGDYVAKIGENSLDFYAEDSSWPEVKRVAEEQSFFHWDLEFIDIFYDVDGTRKRNPGFDTVIGNPPYVRQENLNNKQVMQLLFNNSLYDNISISNKTDLSGYFYYQTLNVLKKYGKLGFITIDSWMHVGYGRSIRNMLLVNYRLEKIIKYNFSVFKDVDVSTITIILKKLRDVKNNHVYLGLADSESAARNLKFSSIKKTQSSFESASNWNDYFTNTDLTPKIQMVKMSDVGVIKFGKKTGLTEFFVLTTKMIQEYDIAEQYRKPVLSGNIREGLLSDDDAVEYLLDVNETKTELSKTKDGKRVLRYINIGEDTQVLSRRGKNNTMTKIPDLPTMKSRKLWYSLNLGTPPQIFLSRLINRYVRIYENNNRFHARNNFIYFTPNRLDHACAFLAYFASSWFMFCLEKNGHAMGGGALSVETIDYKNTLVPDFDQLSSDDIARMSKSWNLYRQNHNRMEIDNVVMSILGFNSDNKKLILNTLELLAKRRMK